MVDSSENSCKVAVRPQRTIVVALLYLALLCLVSLEAGDKSCTTLTSLTCRAC